MLGELRDPIGRAGVWRQASFAHAIAKMVEHPFQAPQLCVPLEGLEALDDLVGTSRAAGLTVEVARHGDLDGLPADTSRTAYRILQEALTNAAKHAGPGRVRVGVRRTAGLLAVEVVDQGGGSPTAGSPDRPGHGLVGMRERVTAAGGTMAAGPDSGAGWRVRVELPTTGRETT